VSGLPPLITNASNHIVTPVFWGVDHMTRVFKKHSLFQLVSTVHAIASAEYGWISASVEQYLIDRKLPTQGLVLGRKALLMVLDSDCMTFCLFSLLSILSYSIHEDGCLDRSLNLIATST